MAADPTPDPNAPWCCPAGFYTREEPGHHCPDLYQNQNGRCCNNSGSTFTFDPGFACPTIKAVNVCKFVTADKQDACMQCMYPPEPAIPGSWTAIGCIPSDPTAFIGKLLSFGVGIAGGIAFLLMLFAGLQMMTSAGNPERLNAGKELMGAALMGLLLIIFSVFILRLIGFTILRIPGFG